MKNVIAFGALMLSFGALAATAPVANAKPVVNTMPLSVQERAERMAKMQNAAMAKVGGFVARPGSQKGAVYYVDCQKRVPKTWIDELIAYFEQETKFNIGYKTGTFEFASPKIEGEATLFVIDDEKLPVIMVAPENRWAFVNVAVIAKEQRPAFFEARVKKQLSRGFAYLCGASNSQYPRCLTRGIVDEADLDKNADYSLPVDVIQRFKSYMETLGVTPEIRVTYRKAVQEGWAPKPANEHQQRIWDEMHAIPTQPMVIKPEKHPAK